MSLSKEEIYKVKTLEQKISTGDLDAMMSYAEFFERHTENITDEIAKKIVKCYETCLAEGNLTAALNLGAMYYCGEFIPRDFKKAKTYYEMATASDEEEIYIRAWCNLGYCYYYGRDIPVDDEKAFYCYLRGATSGDANCLYKIGDMFRYGRFVKQDISMAVFFYQRAWDEVYKSDWSYPDVCKRIGECALYGIGMERDLILALERLTDAEIYTYKKIKAKDAFAPSLLPKIQEMLAETKKLLQSEEL